MKENAEKLNEKMPEIPELVEEEVKKEEETVIPEKKTELNMKKETQKLEKFVFFQELLALKGTNLKIIPIFEDIDKICEKKKLQGFFDVAVLGFIHGAYIKKTDFLKILKKNADIFVENARYLVPLKPKEREELNMKLVECAKTLNLKEQSYSKNCYTRFSLE